MQDSVYNKNSLVIEIVQERKVGVLIDKTYTNRSVNK